MSKQTLRQLLHEVDAAASPPPSVPADLPVQIRLRWRRRRNRRRAVVIATAAVVVTGACLAAWLRPRQEEPAELFVIAPSDRGEAQRALVSARRLAAEADARSAALEQILVRRRQTRRLAALRIRLADLQAEDTLELHLNRAAETLARRACGDDRAALTLYRRIIELFPEARVAQFAREKLEEEPDSSPAKGESS